MNHRGQIVKILTWVAALVIFMAASTPYQSALADNTRDYELRAAMIFNFARFTRWPNEAFSSLNGDIAICASNQSTLYTALKEIEGKSIRGKKVWVKNATYFGDGIDGCHVVVLTEENARRHELRDLGNTLVIAAAEGVGSEIVSIELVDIGRQVRFIVNPAAAKASGVEISSKLIDLAVRVR